MMLKLQTAFLYWKLALLKVSGKAAVAAVLSIAATLNGAEWSLFTGTQKFLAVAAALASMWAVIDAFLDSTMGELRSGHMPGEETTSFRETTHQTVTTKETKELPPKPTEENP